MSVVCSIQRGPYGGVVEARVGGQVVGVLDYAPDGFVEYVHVHPHYRRQGIATALADHMAQHGIEPLFAEGGEDTGNTQEGSAWLAEYLSKN